MRVVTWNINSIRLRIELLRQVVETLRPDVVCLQEIKVVDELFPAEACRALGFPHIAFHGMKGYNGVAILSKLPIRATVTPSWCGREDRRHLVAKLDQAEIHCLYVPAGGDIPDPDKNDKFAHKLEFLRQLTAWYAANYTPEDKLILTGDLNIAPLETDVWSHKQLLSVVSHTPVEVDLLNRMQASLGWVDAMREFIPPDQRLYTWWSYRSPDWQKNDRGRRLDHVWVSPVLRQSLRSVDVLRDCRSWPQPSDHVPVLVELAL
ncbi:exodeoxyribonuclease III [Magnetospirillum sulfuroxidans]|uniref:Exodeoxyribonuclease III n=1 Tax=Magnetospirillum sulfuroxidans TaxID=611300 RepID=A0ABS5IE47_9PROT|nr:exodeoxyribonuclease III [Magnetospirillum sulfuroxidans]MBR9972675.1 exodeoxyribonuclease III [Magnetospirillum sulfuroxidans]